MNIVWLTWKDTKHPLAGGAEVVSAELAKRLAGDGHKVKFIVGGFAGAKAREQINGYEVNRVGGRISVYYRAWRFYRRNKLDKWTDLVIEEVNTLPFMARFYSRRPTILFVHQLCRQIWFYELPKPLGLMGYMLEPLYLWLLRGSRVVTVSQSTKKDLMRFGFSKNKIAIISEGIQLQPLKSLSSATKYSQPTMLSLGSVRSMKRTLHQIKAFELVKERIKPAKLKVAGDYSGKYGQKVQSYIQRSAYAKDIELLGKVSPTKKLELMRKCHVITVTSVKEGWGLIVTEAASQGTPAVVYNIDGLRDSVRHNWSGCVVSHNSPVGLADKIEELLSDDKRYERFRKNAWQWSQAITFEESYKMFRKVLQ